MYHPPLLRDDGDVVIVGLLILSYQLDGWQSDMLWSSYLCTQWLMCSNVLQPWGDRNSMTVPVRNVTQLFEVKITTFFTFKRFLACNHWINQMDQKLWTVIGDVAYWLSIRLEIEKSLVPTRVFPIYLCSIFSWNLSHNQLNCCCIKKKKNSQSNFFLILCRNKEFLTWLRHCGVGLVPFTEWSMCFYFVSDEIIRRN